MECLPVKGNPTEQTCIRPPRKAGDECDEMFICEPRLECKNGTCIVPRLELWEKCNKTEDSIKCAEGLVCKNYENDARTNISGICVRKGILPNQNSIIHNQNPANQLNSIC